MLPLDVPFTIAEAPMTGSPLASTILPEMVLDCAKALAVIAMAEAIVSNLLENGFQVVANALS